MKIASRLNFAFALLLVTLFVPSGLGSNSAQAQRPNIIVIMCDDLGYADVGFNGSPDIITPHLDALAEGGTVLTSGYVAHPFCGPSRMAFMTGRSPHLMGTPYNLPESRDGESVLGVPLDEMLMSTALQNAGYTTGLVGKWHLGKTPPYHPNARGFDDFYGFLGGGHSFFPEQYRAAYEQQVQAGNANIWDYLLPLEHNGEETRETEYLTDALSDEAIRFVREAATNDAPFFLFLSYNAPHTPLEAREEDMAMFPDIEDADRRTYAGMVYAVDRGVGELSDTLREIGAFDNTLIVFLSDNGGRLDEGGNNAPLRGGKGSALEGGSRVPMFFHWPDGVPAGRVYEHPVTTLDFYPTFVGLAGGSIPEDKVLDGVNLWDAFLAGQNAREGGLIYSVVHRNGYSDVGVRMDRWKLTRINHREWMLFDAQDDPGEQYDLSHQHPEIVQQLVGEMHALSEHFPQPQWWHAPSAAQTWADYSMPNEGTFSLEVNPLP